MTTRSSTNANVGRWVAERASTDPRLAAIRQGAEVLSFAELDDASARGARVLLARGLTAGDLGGPEPVEGPPTRALSPSKGHPLVP